MGVAHWGTLSLGQWEAICRGWIRAHGGKIEAPTDAEFEAAVASARG